MGRFIDLTGLRFGRLVVVRQEKNYKHNIKWFCRCDCGNYCSVAGGHLKNGHTTSCGCAHKEMLRQRELTHGSSNTRLYNIWIAMKGRCNNPNNGAYKNYGGRGIKACDEWNESFEKFKNWALQNGYSNKLCIERKDNNGNYEPSNCGWATQKEQSLNTRRNVMVEINGVKKCLKEWIDIYSINKSTFASRYYQRKWPIVKALTTPVYKKEEYFDGISHLQPYRRTVYPEY